MEKLTSWLIGNNFFWKFFSKAYLYFFLLSSANANPEFQGRGGENIASKIVNTLNNNFHLNDDQKIVKTLIDDSELNLSKFNTIDKNQMSRENKEILNSK